MRTEKPVLKIFRIVSLGEEVALSDIHSALRRSFVCGGEQREAFFSVTDCTDEELDCDQRPE
jgi:hypothetical protein